MVLTPIWPDLLLPPVVAGLIGGVSTALAVLAGFWWQGEHAAANRRAELTLRSRTSVLSPLLRKLESAADSTDMYDGTIGALFNSIRELLYHEDIPYAQLASESAMSTVNAWFDAQEEAHDFATRVSLWVTGTSYKHRNSDSLPLETFFRWHVPLPRFKTPNAPELTFELTPEERAVFGELLQGTVDHRDPLKTLRDSAIDELRSALREPGLIA